MAIDSTEAFFSAVLPWSEPGFCSVHGLMSAGMPGTNYERLGEFVAQLATLANGIDWYFALGRHTGNRERACVTHLASLFIDADVKAGGHASKDDAIAALLQFCQRAGIPPPSCIVDSGGGIHAYWFSDQALPIQVWQRYADGLKRACAQYGFKADPSVTADAARVLRIPGTQNYKEAQPRPVEIIPAHSPGTRYDFTADFKALLDPQAPDIAPSLAHLKPFSLVEGVTFPEVVPEFETVLNGCPWLRHIHDTHGQDQPEPLWREALRCCTFFDDGETLAHALGSNHPDYSEAGTEKKYQQALASKEKFGWPQCDRIHTLHSDTDLDNPCDGCPHFGKIKSPLNLSSLKEAKAKKAKGKPNDEIEPDNEEMKYEAERRELVRPPAHWHMPDRCWINKDEHIFYYIQMIKGGTFIQLLKSRIRDPGLQWHHGEYWFGCTVNTEMQREVEVSVMVSDILKGTSISKLGGQLMLIETSPLAAEK